jgi:dipeptidyl aminopeptidase/acylaminoacyl peptidase
MKHAALAAVLVALVVAVPAQATFPGENGRIAYTWSRGGEGFESGPSPRLVGVVTIRPDGRDKRLVARGGSEPRYSPDGARMAFLRSHRLWVARADGSDARPVTPRDWLVGEHEWSPGGSRVAFVRAFETSVRTALYRVAPDGSGLELLVKAPMPVSLSSGAWSPNGRAIIYAQGTFGGSVVRVVRAGEVTTLARPGGAATWSSGGLIAYDARVARGQRDQVCLTRPGRQVPIHCFAAADASITGPIWSPDGHRLMIMYTPQGERPAEMWTVRPDGTVLTRVPRPGVAFPVFSPDGRRLVFNLFRLAGDPRLQFMDLFAQRVDGTGRRLLVRGGQAQSPDWQPRP